MSKRSYITAILVIRNLKWIDIEGTYYDEARMDLSSFHGVSGYRPSVKVSVFQGKRKIYKSTFTGTLLHIYRNGQIEISGGGITQIVIVRDIYGSYGKIRRYSVVPRHD